MVVGSSLLVLFSRFIEMANANGTATSLLELEHLFGSSVWRGYSGEALIWQEVQ